MRFFGYDVRNDIKTKLTSDFNLMIATMRTERSDTTIPDCINFTIDNPINQYPEISIDITESQVLNEDELTSDVNLIPEIYTVEITAILKTQSTSIDNYADYYIEAMQRVLQGYNTSDITWLLITKTNRDDIADRQNQTYKICGVTVEVRIN